ncbi:MFS transporter [Amycolatopsis anabasis]|uniref:MFS transporter n=1 Tax=Amycolatopsis anabasis TaxID=1840409 RepID=UPI00131B6054|nr:MFS transporter [Amycolatopsis anabasis]
MTHRQIMRAFSGLLLALLVAILSSTIVSNALPTILADLDGSQSQYTWVVTATLLTSTATTPIWGKLADLFSKKLLYQLAIVIFTAGSALGGIAQSMPELIAFRALQGVGMGGLQALIQVVIAAMIAPRDRGRYSGYIGATFAVATVSGPLVGGLIVDSPLGWRWCFWVCVPIAVLAFVVLGKTLHLPVVKRPVKIDWFGATLLVGGVALLLIWVSLAGKSFGWLSWSTVLYVGGALVALALAVFVESRVSEPVVPLRLFRSPTFTLAVLGTLAVGTAMFGGAVFLGQYYQISRGFSPTHAGLMTLPMVLGLFLSSTIAGQIISRTGKTKPFLLFGAITLPVGLFLLSTVDHTTNLTLMGVYLALMGIGVGCLMQNLVLVVQNTVGMRDMGSASSVVTFFRTLGGSAGVSALGAVLATRVSANITSSLAALGVPAGHAVGSGGGTLNVGALPGPIQQIVRAAYGDATGKIFLIAGFVSLVTLVAVLFLRETPLRSTLDAVPAGATVTGAVRTPGGRAVGGATVVLTDPRGEVVASGLTGGDGGYRLDGLAAGTYALTATAADHQPVAVPLSVPAGERVDRDVELGGRHRLGVAAGHPGS